MDEVAHVQRKIAALERLMRDNEHAFACDLEQLTRLIARHRMNACILAVQLATDRAALQRLTGGGATS